MKCEDPDRTDGSEGDILISVCGSRTKAGGSKSIRYRFSSSSKLCRLNDILMEYYFREIDRVYGFWG
jgi:hypothetical protein